MRESRSLNYTDVDAKVCRRCGIRGEGQHPAPWDRRCEGCACIDAMRERIADLEFQVEGLKTRLATPRKGPERRGGRRENRRNARYVVLDGTRLCLADAARALGVTTSTLHLRIIARTHDRQYREVDIRAIGADVATRPSSHPSKAAEPIPPAA